MSYQGTSYHQLDVVETLMSRGRELLVFTLNRLELVVQFGALERAEVGGDT